MARKPKHDEELKALELDDVYSAEPLSAALESLYSELDIDPQAGQVQVHITKIGPVDGKEARIWQGTPADYDLNALAKRFGSAEYRVKIYAANPLTKGGMSLRGSKTFKMELDPQDDARLELMRKGIAQPQVQQPMVTPELLAVMIAQAVRQAMPLQAPPPINPMEVIKGLADVFKSMMPTTQPGMNALDALKTAASILNEMRGDEGEPIQRGVNATGMDVFMKLIDKFGPALLAASVNQPGQPAQAALAAPVKVEGAQPETEDQAVTQFKMGLAFLVNQAMADNDPAVYAEMILDNVPEADVEKFLQNDNWLDYLGGFESRVKNFPKWFTELREAVIELRKETGDGAASDALTDGAEAGKTH